MKPFLRVVLGVLTGALVALGAVALYGALAGRRPDAAPALPDGPAAVITHVAGPVFVLRGNDTFPASPGDRLEAGDIVKVTDGAVAQVQLADRGTARLASNTLVRFMKLTGADRNLEVRTEILTGSLLYKVETLAEDESLVIEVDGASYEVRGTEFLLERRDGQTLLAVREGTVAVTGAASDASLPVGAGQELRLAPGSAVPDEAAPLSPEAGVLLDDMAPMPAMPFGVPDAPKPVLVEIVTVPGDAVIYLDGLMTGTGRFRGLIPAGTDLRFRVRRRGFQDSEFSLRADRDVRREIALTPSGVEETMAETSAADPALSRLRDEYERRMAEIRLGYEAQGRQDADALASLKAEQARREADLADQAEENRLALEQQKAQQAALQAQLTQSQAEISRLKALLIQIQDLSGGN